MYSMLKEINNFDNKRAMFIMKKEEHYEVIEEEGTTFIISEPMCELGITKLNEIVIKKNNKVKTGEVEIDKTCSCGKHFCTIPISSAKNSLGYWWNCKCGSTLLYSFKASLR